MRTIKVWKSVLAAAALLLLFFPAFPREEKAVEPVLEENLLVKALCFDAAGNLWVGSEDQGALRVSWSPNGSIQTRRFGPEDGFPDEPCNALECDARGRIWAGLQFGGVAVWNGEAWKAYDCLTGPLSGRVFAIRTNPATEDVWIATDAGISVWHDADGAWSHLSRQDGLPEDQVNAVAFRRDGEAVLAMQSTGLVFVSLRRAQDGRRAVRIRNVRAPAEARPIPPSDRGKGLPSDLVNDVLVVRGDSAIVAATTAGLAWSKDGGKSWLRIGGVDRARKAKLLEKPRPEDAESASSSSAEELLPADFAMRLVELPGLDNRILVATREAGCAVFDLRNERIRDVSETFRMPDPWKKDAMIGAFAVRGAALYAGFLPGGVTKISAPAFASARTRMRPIRPRPPHPVPEPPPSDEELRSLIRELRALPPVPDGSPKAVLLREDWATKGDWFGRYGRRFAILCAAASPRDHKVCWKGGELSVMPWLASSAVRGKDRLRLWLHSENEDCNRNVLFDPVFGIRLQGSWDDHKEAYPLEFDGPDIFLQIDYALHRGVYLVSFYFHNKDGASGPERWRDYVLEIKRPVGERSAQGWKSKDPERDEVPLAATRVTDYRGGVYKTFLVVWPSEQPLYALLRANWSFNTELCAVMIDRLDGDSSGRRGRPGGRLPFVDGETPDFLKPFIEEAKDPAAELRETAFAALFRVGGETRFYRALRAACQARGRGRMEALPPQWRADFKCWLPEDRAEFDRLIDLNRDWLRRNKPAFLKPDLRTDEFRARWSAPRPTSPLESGKKGAERKKEGSCGRE